jgi:DNA-binding IclR family transcriptional regulator
VIAILEHVVSRPDGATLTELAAHTGAPKTSLVGLCKALVAEDCLRRNASGRYQAGQRIFALAMRATDGRELIELARPWLLELSRITGETAVLGAMAPDDDVVVYLDKMESSQPIRYAVNVGERRELYCTALGKTLLAHFPAERLDRYLSTRPLVRYTDSTLCEAPQLHAELDRIRTQGIGHNRGERVRDADGVAAAVFGADGRPVAGLLIAGPARRMEAHLKRNEAAVRRAAAALTRALGGSVAERLPRPDGRKIKIPG